MKKLIFSIILMLPVLSYGQHWVFNTVSEEVCRSEGASCTYIAEACWVRNNTYELLFHDTDSDIIITRPDSSYTYYEVYDDYTLIGYFEPMDLGFYYFTSKYRD